MPRTVAFFNPPPQFHRLVGSYHYNKKQYDKAIADFDEFIRLEPDMAFLAYEERGNAYYDKEQYDKAKADYDEAIRLYPYSASAYRERSDVEKAMGDIAASKADLAKAKELELKYR